MSALENQIGGDHYKKMKIQPFEFSMANNLNPIQHTIIKYVVRHKEKNKLQDLEKAIHCVKLLAEFEYPGTAYPKEVSTPSKMSGGFLDLASLEAMIDSNFPARKDHKDAFFRELKDYLKKYGVNFADTYFIENPDQTKLFT
jgi:hypothetical protein